MARRRGDTHRLIRWLWTSRRMDARLVRIALLPLSGCWWAWMRARREAYARGWLPVADLPLPAVAIGNLTVGGSGKTPVAIWVARYYAERGRRPAVLLRGYGGGDEVLVHAQALPGTVVVASPDRVAGAEQAVARGAEVLVLDDAYQRLDVLRDLNLLVMSAEASRAVRWPLPAGPWREGWSALARADLIVVTRKRATAQAAAELAADLEARTTVPVAIAHLGLSRLVALRSGQPLGVEVLAGRRVLVATAIGDPESFVSQVKATGAAVQAATWPDHHDFGAADLAWLTRAASRVDHIVMTEKDAVKLRDRWPPAAPEPLVAALDLAWEAGAEAVRVALDAVVTPVESLDRRLENP